MNKAATLQPLSGAVGHIVATAQPAEPVRPKRIEISCSLTPDQPCNQPAGNRRKGQADMTMAKGIGDPIGSRRIGDDGQ